MYNAAYTNSNNRVSGYVILELYKGCKWQKTGNDSVMI